MTRKTASKKRNKTQHIYRPPKWAFDYLAATLNPEITPSIAKRCEAIGVERSTFYRALHKTDFVAWLNDHLTEAIVGHGREVRAALVRKCLAGDLEAMRLWLERYDHYRKPAGDEDLETKSKQELSDIAREMAETPDGAGPAVH